MIHPEKTGPGEIQQLQRKQRAFFESGKTRDVDFRIAQLDRLAQGIRRNETRLMAALRADLKKPAFEAFGGEIGFFYEEYKFVRKRLHRWAAARRVPTPVAHFPASSWIYPEPKGLVLVIAPWNYPFNLVVSPLIGAIAAGNCAVLKPSELAPATSEATARLLAECFDPEYVTAVEGDVAVNQALLEEPWDHVFFTGSTAVGKIVMAAAAKHLTPVTLELGGKSPCLVDRNVPWETTARRIAWGKFFNAGQTCVAPDYVLVHREDKPRLLEGLRGALTEFFGPDPRTSPDYARIINERHFRRVASLLDGATVAIGGETDAADRYIAPTVLTDVGWDSPAMREEIFGPVLPVIEIESIEEGMREIARRPRPLSLYVFSKDGARQREVLRNLSFGGGCVNDTIVHLSNPHLPFGGIGASGMGMYHGKYSFDTFSHFKGVLNKSLLVDIKLRYQPYKEKVKLLQRLFGA